MDGERIIKLSSQGSSCVRFLKPLKEEDRDEDDEQLMIPSFSQYTGDLSETPLIQVPRHCSIKTLKLNPQTQGGTGREFPRRLCDPLLLPLSPPVHLPSPIVIGSHPPVPHHITLRYWELLLKLGKKVFIHKPVTNVLYPKCSGFFLFFLLLTVQGYELFRTGPS